MAPEVVERKVTPEEAVEKLISAASSMSSAAEEARYMMHQFRKHSEAHTFWCSVVYLLETISSSSSSS